MMDLLRLLLHTFLLLNALFQVSWGTTSSEGNCYASNKNIINLQNHPPFQDLIRRILENGYSLPVYSHSQDEVQAGANFSTLTDYELEAPFEAKVEEEVYHQKPQPVEYRNDCHALNQESFSSSTYVNQINDYRYSPEVISNLNSGMLNPQEKMLNWNNHPNIQTRDQNQQTNTGYCHKETLPNEHCILLFEVPNPQFQHSDTELLLKTYPQNTLTQSKSLKDFNNNEQHKQNESDNFENQQFPVLEALQQNNLNLLPYDTKLNWPYQPSTPNYSQNQPQTNENVEMEVFQQCGEPLQNINILYSNKKPMNWQNQQDIFNYYQNQYQVYRNDEKLEIQKERVGHENCPLSYEVERNTFEEQKESLPLHTHTVPSIDKNQLNIQNYIQDQSLSINNIRQSDDVVNYNCPYPHEVPKTQFHQTIKESPQNAQGIPVNGQNQLNGHKYYQQINNVHQSLVNENCPHPLLHDMPKYDLQKYASDSLLNPEEIGVKEEYQQPFTYRNENVNKGHEVGKFEFLQSNVDFQQMRYPNYLENCQLTANQMFPNQIGIDQTEYEHGDEECLVEYENNRNIGGILAHSKEKLSPQNLEYPYNEEKLFTSVNQPEKQNSFSHNRYGELYRQRMNENQHQENYFSINNNYNLPRPFRNQWLTLEENVCQNNGVKYSNNEDGYKPDTSLGILTDEKIIENYETVQEETLVEKKCVYVLSSKQWEKIMEELSQVKVYPQEFIERCFTPGQEFMGKPDIIGCGNLDLCQEYSRPIQIESQTPPNNNISWAGTRHTSERYIPDENVFNYENHQYPIRNPFSQISETANINYNEYKLHEHNRHEEQEPGDEFYKETGYNLPDEAELEKEKEAIYQKPEVEDDNNPSLNHKKTQYNIPNEHKKGKEAVYQNPEAEDTDNYLSLNQESILTTKEVNKINNLGVKIPESNCCPCKCVEICCWRPRVGGCPRSRHTY